MGTYPQCHRLVTTLTDETAYGTATADGSLNVMYHLVEPALAQVDFDVESDADFIKGFEWNQSTTRRIQLFQNGSVSFSNVPANAQLLSWLLGVGLGSISTAGAGDPYTHTIKPQSACGTNGLQLPSRTFVLAYEDAGGATSSASKKYKGGIVQSFTLRANQKGRLTCDFTIQTDGSENDGSGITIPASFASSDFYYGKDAVYAWETFGTAVAANTSLVRSFEFSFTNNLLLDEAKAKKHGWGSTTNVDELWFDTREYTFSMVINADETTTDAGSDVIYSDFINATNKVFQATFSSGGSSNRDLVIKFPSIVWNAEKGYEGPRRILTLTPDVFYDSSSSAPVVITIKTADSAIQ